MHSEITCALQIWHIVLWFSQICGQRVQWDSIPFNQTNFQKFPKNRFPESVKPLCHYHMSIRIICDVSKADFGAVLQQQDETGWRPIHLASHFLTPLEDKNSINELEKAKQCNFQILGATATGIYRFSTGFYGLTIMPTEFQKAMDKELSNHPNTYVFLDDILIVTNETKKKHYKVVKQK